jgi:hypothetical protein
VFFLVRFRVNDEGLESGPFGRKSRHMCCGTDTCSIDCLRLIATLDDSRRLLPTNLLSHLSWVSITTLQVLAASSTEVPAIRRELQSKYSVHVGGLDSTQPRSGLAENTLHEVADLLDGMVKRAEQGRGSITALRAAVSNVSVQRAVF